MHDQGYSPDPVARPLDLIDTALEWMVRESARGSAVRHLIHDATGRSLCRVLPDGFVLKAGEVGEHRACRSCTARDVAGARLAPIDFGEIEPEFRVGAFGAVSEAIQRLAELSAWVDFDGTAAHLQDMSEELSGLMADHYRDRWKAWADMPTVEHPLGDLEGEGG